MPNPYIFTVECDVCGGEAAADIETAGAAWRPGTTITHRDPSICRDVIERRKRREERERKEAELEATYGALSESAEMGC